MSSPFAAPYAQPAPGVYAPPPPPVRRRTLGVVARLVAVITVPVASVVGAIAGWRVGLGTGKELAGRPRGAAVDLSVLTPVRYDVLLGEVAFWVATALGVWAVVQGIVAIVRARGRGQGIAAVIVAGLGPLVFGAAVFVLLTAGMGAGTGIGG
jgi:hypothetical protein